jgi:hypothetical protein
LPLYCLIVIVAVLAPEVLTVMVTFLSPTEDMVIPVPGDDPVVENSSIALAVPSPATFPNTACQQYIVEADRPLKV